MNQVSVRLLLRFLAFLIILSFSWSYLQLQGPLFETVFLGWLNDVSRGSLVALQNDSQEASMSLACLNLTVDSPAKPRKLLGVASSITVISLPVRTDRRGDMDVLRRSLGIPELEWKYVDAIASNDERVQKVMEWVIYVRSTIVDGARSGPKKYKFSWLDEEQIERLVESEEALDIWQTVPWKSPFGASPVSGLLSGSGPSLDSMAGPSPFLISATRNFLVNISFSSSDIKAIPQYRKLTTARIACWYSHLEAIARIANAPIRRENETETAIILEDDVDMESDIEEQLTLLWPHLPQRWDIVFLGHCWSNESHYAPVKPSILDAIHILHPSYRPKCTHAYALSRLGARRILLHLRYPPFAFSRAIDQALAWLVESGRLKEGSFSVVPSLVVQRKVRKSDVSAGKRGGIGSRWKEKLRNGILDGARLERLSKTSI